MSLILETLNRGHVENFGFVFDSTRIRLGDDLPAMSVPQFCKYSTDAILETFKHIPDPSQASIRKIIAMLKSSTKDLTVIPYQDPSAETELTTTESIEKIEDIDVRRVSYPPQIMDDFGKALQEGRLSDALARNLTAAFSEALGVSIHHYSENPFRGKGSNIEIEYMYEIALPEFTAFTAHILRGGFLGWGGPDKRIIPDCAATAVVKLSQLSAD